MNYTDCQIELNKHKEKTDPKFGDGFEAGWFALSRKIRDRFDVEKLVNRFLAWPLPESVCSDSCVTQKNCPHRIGTNLLTAAEAKEMFEYVLQGSATSIISSGKSQSTDTSVSQPESLPDQSVSIQPKSKSVSAPTEERLREIADKHAKAYCDRWTTAHTLELCDIILSALREVAV